MVEYLYGALCMYVYQNVSPYVPFSAVYSISILLKMGIICNQGAENHKLVGTFQWGLYQNVEQYGKFSSVCNIVLDKV